MPPPKLASFERSGVPPVATSARLPSALTGQRLGLVMGSPKRFRKVERRRVSVRAIAS